jgi:hypothetical protein
MAAKDCNHGREAVSRRCDNRFEYALPILTGYLMVREAPPDPSDVLGRFSDARCLLDCAFKALDQRQDASRPGAEIVCMQYALEMLRDVYTELDFLLTSHCTIARPT